METEPVILFDPSPARCVGILGRVVLDQQTLQIVAIAGAGVGVVSVLLAVGANARLARIKRGIRALQGASVRGEMVLPAEELVKQMDALANEVDALRSAVAQSVQGVGVVRFDAFEDMGGHLSFSAAFLDGHGDGVVLTSINGRQETRIYAKPVTGAQSQYNLSEEEQEAIRRALASR
ncbi:MAG: DUF4446 family protein [Actinomycetota bacterium]